MSSSNIEILPVCKYGEKCYRLNIDHFRQYSHPHLEKVLSDMNDNESAESHADNFPGVERETFVTQLQLVKRLTDGTGGDNNCDMMNIDIPQCYSAGSPAEADTAPTEDTLTEDGPTNIKRMKFDDVSDVRSISSLEERLMLSEPYRFFLSSINSEPRTYSEPLTVSFQELLNGQLGDLCESLHINFMVELGWLLAQYYLTGNRGKPITLLYGEIADDVLDQSQIKERIPHMTAICVEPLNPFGHHHSKMMVLTYTDNSIRVIVLTANLVELDWDERTQGIWISPRLPCIDEQGAEKSAFDSPTNFKADLIRYLRSYNLFCMNYWISKIENADFRAVNVFLLPSVPGTYTGNDVNLWGHGYLRKLLKKNLSIPSSDDASSHSLIYQASSIGSLGAEPTEWFLNEFSRTASTAPGACPDVLESINVVYPTENIVNTCYGGFLSTACLPYSIATHKNQMWLNSYFRRWKSEKRYRTKAVPHIKSYCRISACNEKLYWFILTSANLSKAAWGKITSTGKFQVYSYELGVMFFPQFVTGENVFKVKGADKNFPLPFDVPLIPYGEEDKPHVRNPAVQANLLLRRRC